MADVFDRATRSRNMAAIRGRHTKPELIVRRYLHGRGLRYRLHHSKLPGRPDLVFRGLRTVVFIHGCFWHRHAGCRFAVLPRANADFCGPSSKVIRPVIVGMCPDYAARDGAS